MVMTSVLLLLIAVLVGSSITAVLSLLAWRARTAPVLGVPDAPPEARAELRSAAEGEDRALREPRQELVSSLYEHQRATQSTERSAAREGSAAVGSSSETAHRRYSTASAALLGYGPQSSHVGIAHTMWLLGSTGSTLHDSATAV